MTYKDTGFRALYKSLSAFPLTDIIKDSVDGFPDADQANCVLTYGYVDQTAGFTLEILAAGIKTEKGFRFFDGSDECSAKIRIDAVEDAEFALLKDTKGTLRKRYAGKIGMLASYDASEEVEKSRTFGFLDSCRDAYCIDDVLVVLEKDGLQPEGCWTRIIGLGDHYLMGTLLNEPYQDFGYHAGEKIAFFVRKTEDNKVTCYTDMNPSAKLTAEDLEDGSMLKAAIHTFLTDRTEPHFIDIMELLRDSDVWIPCNAIIGNDDLEALNQAVAEAEESGDMQSLVGRSFTSRQEIRMVPDILRNGDNYFFPVFSSDEEMGGYGDRFSKVQAHFLEAISMARNSEKEITGIVINAFTEPFILEAKIFDLVEKLKSRI